jgi:hypothetical protein
LRGIRVGGIARSLGDSRIRACPQTASKPAVRRRQGPVSPAAQCFYRLLCWVTRPVSSVLISPRAGCEGLATTRDLGKEGEHQAFHADCIVGLDFHMLSSASSRLILVNYLLTKIDQTVRICVPSARVEQGLLHCSG